MSRERLSFYLKYALRSLRREGQRSFFAAFCVAVGFVFQFFNLIPTLTALENVELPVQFAARARFDPTRRARELLELVGLGDRLHHRPPELSGGEQQRVAIARALANDPPLLLADEPTGNLDSATGEEILRLLRRLCDESGQTVIMVTHDPRVAAYADRVAFLRDGRIVEEARLERGRDARMVLARLAGAWSVKRPSR